MSWKYLLHLMLKVNHSVIKHTEKMKSNKLTLTIKQAI